MNKTFHSIGPCIFLVLLASADTYAQSTTLPRPSQTVYKCIDSGKVTYSDNPCPDAKKIDVKPSNGFSKWSGKERVGSRVSRERQQAQIAEALKPITGMNPKEFKTFGDRQKLSENAKIECRSLDKLIPQSEAMEQSTQGAEKTQAKKDLYRHRRRYRELRC